MFHPRAFIISVSDFPFATAISTKAFEIASFEPSYIMSWVTSTPKLFARSLILSKFGFDANAEVILFKLYWAVIKPFNWLSGSSPCCVNAWSYCNFFYSTASRLAFIYS